MARTKQIARKTPDGKGKKTTGARSLPQQPPQQPKTQIVKGTAGRYKPVVIAQKRRGRGFIRSSESSETSSDDEESDQKSYSSTSEDEEEEEEMRPETQLSDAREVNIGNMDHTLMDSPRESSTKIAIDKNLLTPPSTPTKKKTLLEDKQVPSTPTKIVEKKRKLEEEQEQEQEPSPKKVINKKPSYPPLTITTTTTTTDKAETTPPPNKKTRLSVEENEITTNTNEPVMGEEVPVSTPTKKDNMSLQPGAPKKVTNTKKTSHPEEQQQELEKFTLPPVHQLSMSEMNECVLDLCNRVFVAEKDVADGKKEIATLKTSIADIKKVMPVISNRFIDIDTRIAMNKEGNEEALNAIEKINNILERLHPEQDEENHHRHHHHHEKKQKRKTTHVAEVKKKLHAKKPAARRHNEDEDHDDYDEDDDKEDEENEEAGEGSGSEMMETDYGKVRVRLCTGPCGMKKQLNQFHQVKSTKQKKDGSIVEYSNPRGQCRECYNGKPRVVKKEIKKSVKEKARPASSSEKNHSKKSSKKK